MSQDWLTKMRKYWESLFLILIEQAHLGRVDQCHHCQDFALSNREDIFVAGQGSPIICHNPIDCNGGNGISLTGDATPEIRENLIRDRGFGLAIGGHSTPLWVDKRIVNNFESIKIRPSMDPLPVPVLGRKTQDPGRSRFSKTIISWIVDPHLLFGGL